MMKEADYKQKIMDKILIDYGVYTKKELGTWKWINVESLPDTNIFFDGSYVLFAVDKVVWYSW